MLFTVWNSKNKMNESQQGRKETSTSLNDDTFMRFQLVIKFTKISKLLATVFLLRFFKFGKFEAEAKLIFDHYKNRTTDAQFCE